MNLTRYQIERKLRRMTTAAPVRIGHLTIELGRAQKYGYYLITNGKARHYFYYYLGEVPTKGRPAEIYDAYPDALENAVDYIETHQATSVAKAITCGHEYCGKVFVPVGNQKYCSRRCYERASSLRYQRRRKAAA